MPERSPKPRRRSAAAEAPSESELRRLIAEAAYQRAEKRGFTPGFEEKDWYEAEAEVRARLR